MGESSFISQTNPIFNNTIFDLKDTNYCTVNFVFYTVQWVILLRFIFLVNIVPSFKPINGPPKPFPAYFKLIDINIFLVPAVVYLYMTRLKVNLT